MPLRYCTWLQWWHDMAGIDRSDQMLSYYSGLRKSIRWYKRISFHCTEIFVFNAHWLNTKFGKRKLSLLHFRLVMVKYLLGDMVSQSSQSSLGSPNFHYLKQFPQKKGHKKKYPSYKCRHCSMGSQTTNCRESRFFCDACLENPALCIEPCFKLYHGAIKNRVHEEWLDCYKILIYV